MMVDIMDMAQKSLGHHQNSALILMHRSILILHTMWRVLTQLDLLVRFLSQENVNFILGDTLSNMRIQPEKYLTDEEKRTFAAVYAPAPGFKKDHITVRPPPKQPEPICYSLSAKDMARKKAQEGYCSKSL